MAVAARDRRQATALVFGVAYSVAAAATTPFSWQADLVTALPIGALAVAVALRWSLRPPARPRALAEGVRHPFAPWVVLLAAVVAWELVQYLTAGSRAEHPTLSSMVDAVDRYTALKAVVFFLWLCLGAAIVRSGVGSVAADNRPGVGGGAP
jgi:hypothetical protein